MTEPGGYVLGHAEAELNRLATQAALIDPITRGFFRAAGIAEGMRVLDVGSGAGHTAMLLAEIVGPSGEVVGVDRALVAVQTAERRVAAAGLGNVSFRHGDPSQMRLDGGFDAVAGRYVLMFVPAAADMLRGLLRHLRPGGRIVFHEPDWNGTRSFPPVPAFERVCGWIRQALRGSGASDDFGRHLAEVFAEAGLAAPTLALGATIGAGPSAGAVVRLITDLATTLRPDMRRLGIIPADTPDFADLATVILQDLGPHGTVLGGTEIAAWTRI